MSSSTVTQETTSSQDSNFIPIIDFTPFLTNSPTKLQTAHAILHGFQTAGFIYLTNHSLPPSLISTAFSHSRNFFARPKSQKDLLKWRDPKSNRGYIAHGREKVDNSKDKTEVNSRRRVFVDLKETMEIGKEGVPGMPNYWPDCFDAEGVQFKEFMQEFYTTCHALHRKVLSAIALALNLPSTFFDPFSSKADNNLRLLHYPPVPSSIFRSNPEQLRLGAHSDYGSITMLFQDGAGGLQVLSPGGGFVDARPVEGAVVVNAGDLLARWSNDTIRSTLHRVVEPRREAGGAGEGEVVYPARYSIAYFCNPNMDAVIDVLPGTFGGETGREKVYEPIKTEDHIVERLEATLAWGY